MLTVHSELKGTKRVKVNMYDIHDINSGMWKQSATTN